jgi:hypothetical protein
VEDAFQSRYLWLVSPEGMIQSSSNFLCMTIAIGSHKGAPASSAIDAAGEHSRGNMNATIHIAHDGFLADGPDFQNHGDTPV